MNTIKEFMNNFKDIPADSSFSSPFFTFNVKVIGIGGAGCNYLNQLSATLKDFVAAKFIDLECVAIDTDKKALESCQAQRKLLIGEKVTKGLGTSNDINLGQQAATESKDTIKSLLQELAINDVSPKEDTQLILKELPKVESPSEELSEKHLRLLLDTPTRYPKTEMIILIAGMGGGTGSGATPIIAQIAKELELFPITLAIVTKPYEFESKQRKTNAQMGIENIAKYIACVPLSGQKLIAKLDEKPTLSQADNLLGEIVNHVSATLIKMITQETAVNHLEFGDYQKFLNCAGVVYFGIGIANGQDKLLIARDKAWDQTLVDFDFSQAKNSILLLKYNEDITRHQIEQFHINVIKLTPGIHTYLGLDVAPNRDDVQVITIIK